MTGFTTVHYTAVHTSVHNAYSRVRSFPKSRARRRIEGENLEAFVILVNLRGKRKELIYCFCKVIYVQYVFPL